MYGRFWNFCTTIFDRWKIIKIFVNLSDTNIINSILKSSKLIIGNERKSLTRLLRSMFNKTPCIWRKRSYLHEFERSWQSGRSSSLPDQLAGVCAHTGCSRDWARKHWSSFCFLKQPTDGAELGILMFISFHSTMFNKDRN